MEESERERIIELYKELKSGGKVAEQVDWSRATVYNVIRDAGVCRSSEEYFEEKGRDLKDGYSEMDENLAYIFGVLITDGYVWQQGIGLETVDDEFCSLFQKKCEEKFGIDGNRHNGNERKNEIDGDKFTSQGTEIFRLNSVNLRDYLEKTDIKEKILGLEKRQLKIKALEGMWDSDGSLNVEGRQVLFYKKDKDVIDIYQKLLDDIFDFDYSIRWSEAGSYVCYFGTKDSVKEFFEVVSPTIQRKRRKLETMIK